MKQQFVSLEEAIKEGSVHSQVRERNCLVNVVKDKEKVQIYDELSSPVDGVDIEIEGEFGNTVVTISNKYDPSYCQQLVRLMAKGMSREEAAAEMGLLIRYFKKWEKEHEDFRLALTDGEALAKAWWLKSGRKNLKLHSTEKFNNTLYIFMMKNRYAFISGDERPKSYMLSQSEEYEITQENNGNNNLLESNNGITIDRSEAAEVLDIIRTINPTEPGNSESIESETEQIHTVDTDT